MKKRKWGPIGWILRAVIRLLIAAGVIVAAVFGGCELYFTQVHPMKPTMTTRVQAIIKERHIHPLTYNELPTFYRNAVIATEDRRFATDPGIDVTGIIRSLFRDIQQDGYVEGGSTITQQLVDNTLLSQKKTIKRKVLQALYAIGVYDTMSKHQVFADYANVIYFGHGAYGLYRASEVYFGKPPQDLNEGELAMLAGLPNAPNAYDPYHHMKLAKERQAVVIENMIDAGYLTRQQAKQVAAEKIRLEGQK